MKKILFALMGICALMFSACSSDNNDDGSAIQNFWTLTKENKTLYDSDTKGVKVTVTLAYTAKEAITLTPTITAEGDMEDVFETYPGTVTIDKGEKTAEFYVRATSRKRMSEEGTISLSLNTPTGLRAGDALILTAEPMDNVTLTNDQMANVQAWINTYGIDVRPLIGSMEVTTTITFNEDDMYSYNNSEETATYTSYCPITISDNADSENIILHMEGNALGLKDFLYSMLLAQSAEDEEYWLSNSHNADLLTAINYNKDTERFSVSLDIQLNPDDNSITFTGTILDSYGDEIEGIPFQYEYTAWNRQQALDTFIMDNGDEGKEEISMEEAIDQGITLNPSYFFPASDISYDAWGAGETSLYTEPTGSFDSEKMTFTFPWDFMNASGYNKIEVTITLNNK